MSPHGVLRPRQRCAKFKFNWDTDVTVECLAAIMLMARASLEPFSFDLVRHETMLMELGTRAFPSEGLLERRSRSWLRLGFQVGFVRVRDGSSSLKPNVRAKTRQRTFAVGVSSLWSACYLFPISFQRLS